MNLLSPYWLFAALAVLVPIAIHLWNKRQGKTVKVGSLRWLQPAASKQWSSIKLNNVWLLLLRCLIFIVLAVALAQPVWEEHPQEPQGQKAVYMGEELLYSSALEKIKPTIESLLQRGYSLHRYNSNFEQIPQENWQHISNRTSDSTVTDSTNYWNLLAALAQRHQQEEDSLWLFTSDQQRYFRGTKPASIPTNIHWIPVATEAASAWVQTATQLSSDSLLLIIGQSNRESTTFSQQRIASSAQSINLPNNQKLQLRRRQDSLQIIHPGQSINQVPIQQKPLQVAILYEEAQEAELPYLQAAISAISNYTGLPININTAVAQQPDTAVQWVFWLRNEAVPTQLLQQVAQQGLQLWVQSANRPSAIKTSLTTTADTPVPIHQLSATTARQSNMLWATTNGEELLSVQPIGRGNVYRFRSGFSPAWSGLGQSAQLPELLFPLLFPQPNKTAYDMRALDERQLKPATHAVATTVSTPDAAKQHLLPWYVLAAFVLFLMERIIASRRVKV
ncbi:BatA domain-containing protein [Pontibacter harenae]|uniref:BatA domain-containing protein n=1 Tax=Pontibacter harenae TaxID=2894083 RepID=UPI001E528EE6|nr:BatA domain-containing protein [Pontibacter harenae]MCC9167348.1 BatA domain-containing protein [Pontibacter harenae]